MSGRRPTGAAARSLPQRLLRRMATVVWLTAMWVILWGDASPGTVLAGAGVASGCYAAARLPDLPVRLTVRPLRTLLLLWHIAADLLTSSLRVAVHVLWHPKRMRGVIVEVPMRTDSDLLLALTAAGLSLITGSLVIELNREEGVLYVHGTPIHSERSVRNLRRQVRRTEELFVRAFGTSSDIEQFEREERLMLEAEAADPAEGEA
ncbi:Na+/H+ antiporter subunit E [Streptomonospora wellingtoniae]|uniref:Na+/H+ antiporter subunit E n=1 Tax=Streptomonospora wellingtoniae TaxID=3075544 RepID=A0ABU2KX33_9ACTN|nr:Na+/H+ antiporter subunit E [Streptomonospora sp. DSM 45055]MDT0303658.1 Na+/H+ antiporter subunit E [Streptomonospora sp. DSM 45055]